MTHIKVNVSCNQKVKIQHTVNSLAQSEVDCVYHYMNIAALLMMGTNSTLRL